MKHLRSAFSSLMLRKSRKSLRKNWYRAHFTKKKFNKMDPYIKSFKLKKAVGIQLILPPPWTTFWGFLMTKASVLGIVAGLENWPATAATKLGVCRVEPDSHGLQRNLSASKRPMWVWLFERNKPPHTPKKKGVIHSESGFRMSEIPISHP